MIGISITTRNRPEVFKYSLEQLRKFWNPQLKLIIINDSDKQFLETYQKIINQIRFPNAEHVINEKRLGIPHSKNIAFQKLKDCTHQFWFDDDCYPVKDQWWIDFIEASRIDNFHHYLYLKKWAHIKFIESKTPRTDIYSHGTACLMYFSAKAYPYIEGFHAAFKIYGWWHGVLSNDLHKAGLTPAPFISISNCTNVVKCHDLDPVPKELKGKFSSSMSQKERMQHLKDGVMTDSRRKELKEIFKKNV